MDEAAIRQVFRAVRAESRGSASHTVIASISALAKTLITATVADYASVSTMCACT